MSYDEEWTDIEVLIEHKTGRGVLVSDGETEAWLPISSVMNWDGDWGPGDTVSIDIKVRLATEAGLL